MTAYVAPKAQNVTAVKPETSAFSKKALDAMNDYTIDQIETAINYWRQHQASGDDAALCPRARVLADVYGLMIYRRA